MKKLLIAILTAHRYDYYIDDLTVEYNKTRCLNQSDRVSTIRNTWVKDIPAGVDYRFFYGTKLRSNLVKPNQRPSTIPKDVLRPPLADEVYLDCGDNYTHNPDKMKAICKYALDGGYDYILRVDDDTFVYPDRLLKSDWDTAVYSGSGNGTFHPGGCMFLNRTAMELILAARITHYADDLWIGQVMSTNGVKLHEIPTIHNLFGDGYNVVPETLPIEKLSAFHSCKPEAMKYLYDHKGFSNGCNE